MKSGLIYRLGLRTDQVTGNLEIKGTCDRDSVITLQVNKDGARRTTQTTATATTTATKTTMTLTRAGLWKTRSWARNVSVF
jgi:hypothetical protein